MDEINVKVNDRLPENFVGMLSKKFSCKIDERFIELRDKILSAARTEFGQRLSLQKEISQHQSPSVPDPSTFSIPDEVIT